MDKLIKKLKKLLSKNGVEEEKIEKIVDELGDEDVVADESEEVVDNEPTETETLDVESNEPLDVPVDAPVEELEGETVENEEPADVEVAVADVETPDVEQAVPTDPNEVNPADLIPQDQVSPQVDAEPLAPAQPDPLLEYKAKIDNQAEVIEALQTRIDALENALKNSGIMEDASSNEGTAFGLDNSNTPANNPMDDPMESILNKINKRY